MSLRWVLLNIWKETGWVTKIKCGLSVFLLQKKKMFLLPVCGSYKQGRLNWLWRLIYIKLKRWRIPQCASPSQGPNASWLCSASHFGFSLLCGFHAVSDTDFPFCYKDCWPWPGTVLQMFYKWRLLNLWWLWSTDLVYIKELLHVAVNVDLRMKLRSPDLSNKP